MVTRREAVKKIALLAGVAAMGGGGAGFASPDEAKGSHPAKYWHPLGNDIQCDLCPHGCVLADGKIGKCRGRQNRGKSMVTLGYGYPCAANADPVEKKPLYHFLPGSLAYSIAIAGCNLRCKNCQNYTISQTSPLDTEVPYVPPRAIVDEAKKQGCTSIAYTYSEPSVWFEYMYDTAKLGRSAGLKNIMVTSGFINQEPLSDLAPYLDGAHIDLKSFDESIYRLLNAGNLQPVLDTIVHARKKGVWVEIINLVVPQWTDNLDMIRKLCIWIRENTGADTPLHFSRFFPQYKLAHLYPTPEEVLKKAREIAFKEKLKFVYIGNVVDVDSNTYCPKCRSKLVERVGYRAKMMGMKGANCAKCGLTIPGVWG